MPQNLKKALDEVLKDFERESARLLRLQKKQYNVAVIGCGDVGEQTIALLKDHSKTGRLVVSNWSGDEKKGCDEKSRFFSLDETAEDLPYDKMSEWLVDDDPNKDIDVVIFAAGPWIEDRKGGLSRNAPPVENFAEAVAESGYNGLTIMVNNPVAGLCQQFAVKSGCDPYSVIGFNPDPNRVVRELVKYLKEDHVKNLRKSGNDDKEILNFYENLQESDIKGFRLCGAHAPKVEKPNGAEISCRKGIWKEVRIKGKHISELGDLKVDFAEIANLVPYWIKKAHDEEDALREKLGKKGGHYHARTMVNHFLAMIDGEVEGMGPIVFDPERGIWAARPANCIYHRVQPMSDDKAGITDKVKERFEEICKYYIIGASGEYKDHGEYDRNGEKIDRRGCIEWLKDHGFIDENQERDYLEFAKDVEPPKDEEREEFDYRAENFIDKKREEFESALRESDLSDELRVEARRSFKELEDEFRKEAGLKFPVNVGCVYAVGKSEKGNVYKIALSSSSPGERLVFESDEPITEVHGDDSRLYLVSKKSQDPSHDMEYSCSIRIIDLSGENPRKIDLPIDFSALSVCKDNIYLAYFDNEEYEGRIAKIPKDFAPEDVAEALTESIPLGKRINDIDVYENDGKTELRVSCSGKIKRINADEWKEEKDDAEAKPYTDSRRLCSTYHDAGCTVQVTAENDRIIVRRKGDEGDFKELSSMSVNPNWNIFSLECTKDYLAVFANDETNGGKRTIVHAYKLDPDLTDTKQEFVLDNVNLNTNYHFKEALE